MDRLAFIVTVIAGAIAAVAGWYSWQITAVVAGCTAAVVPIINRLTAKRIAGPRSLSPRQRNTLIESLRSSPTFELWVSHNMEEAEPSALHAQLIETLSSAGLETKWYGGMTNKTIGLQISGEPSLEKARLMKAFKLARIPFQEVIFTDATSFNGVGIWIGQNRGAW